MKKDYNRPLITINEINEKEKISALSVTDGSTVTWTPENPNENGYKEFEW